MFQSPGNHPHSYLPGLCFIYQAATFTLTFLVYVSLTRQPLLLSPSWSFSVARRPPSFSFCWSVFQLPGSHPHCHFPGVCFSFQAATLILTFLVYVTRQPPSFSSSWSMFQLTGSHPHSHLAGLCFSYQAANLILTFLVYVSVTRQPASFSPSWSMFLLPGSQPHSHLPGPFNLPCSHPHSHLPDLYFRYQAATLILTFLVYVLFTR